MWSYENVWVGCFEGESLMGSDKQGEGKRDVWEEVVSAQKWEGADEKEGRYHMRVTKCSTVIGGKSQL